MNAAILIPLQCTLGESPFWHGGRMSYWWVDIEAKKVVECNSQSLEIKQWLFDERVSFLAAVDNDDDTMIVATQGGIVQLNTTTGHKKLLVPLETGIENNRTNDGAIDTNGNIWIGTMDMNCEKHKGSVYCINGEMVCTKKISDTTIANGIVWNLSNNKLFFIDSDTYSVQSYLFNQADASIEFENTVINIPVNLGMPDGMAIDCEGMLWIAQWGSGTVNRWNPANGKMLDSIHVPAPHVTSCTFAGSGLDELIITTATAGLTKEQLAAFPQSGSVFIARPGVKGVAKNKVRL